MTLWTTLLLHFTGHENMCFRLLRSARRGRWEIHSICARCSSPVIEAIVSGIPGRTPYGSLISTGFSQSLRRRHMVNSSTHPLSRRGCKSCLPTQDEYWLGLPCSGTSFPSAWLAAFFLGNSVRTSLMKVTQIARRVPISFPMPK